MRGEPIAPLVFALIGQNDADQIATANHRPGFVALNLGLLLRSACDESNMDRFAFMQIDNLSHLALDEISANLERNLLELLKVSGNAGASERDPG